MQKNLRRRILAGALAAAVSLCASPQAAAEEPALYFDSYGAEFYLTPEEAGEWLPAEETLEADFSLQPVVTGLPEETADGEPAPEESPAEEPPEGEDPPEENVEEDTEPPAGDSLKDLDAAFVVEPVSEPVLYEEQTVEVTVIWGEMKFRYVTGVWTVPVDGDPYYEAPADGQTAGWHPVDNSNTIAFENNGTADVKLTCSYEENNLLDLQNRPTAAFRDESGTSYFTSDATNPEVTLPAKAVDGETANQLKLYVELTGPRPEKALDGAVLGTITATVSAAEEEEQGTS